MESIKQAPLEALQEDRPNMGSQGPQCQTFRLACMCITTHSVLHQAATASLQNSAACCMTGREKDSAPGNVDAWCADSVVTSECATLHAQQTHQTQAGRSSMMQQ